LVGANSNLQLFKTADGSDTLFRSDLNQHYHSTFGAIQESQFIFIESGLRQVLAAHSNHTLHILEMGFGTGLNAFLTMIEVEKYKIKTDYTTVEAFPLDERYWKSLNYPGMTGTDDHTPMFTNLHEAKWNEPVELSPHFKLTKIHGPFETYIPAHGLFNLVYFDAFGPDAQPELWSENIFLMISMGMSPGGILVTYSVKGTVVRALRKAGFLVEKLPGPPGKRHILRAIKS